MKTFYITNIKTNEEEVVFGYTYERALDKKNLNKADWNCWLVEYAD